MFAFVYSFLLLAAASGEHAEGGYMEFYNKYLNYPGFEAWKFINLAIFVAFIVYVAKKPLTEAFKAKRDQIRADLIRAEEEKKAALARFTTAEAKLASLDNERQLILNKAKAEADAEAKRIAEAAEFEVSKLQDQTSGEISRLTQIANLELKRFSADESVRIAEEKLRSNIDANADSNLVRSGIQAIGGLN
ncbi:MAG: ATP synthase F0 subunit B [Pyrinomonadaceae bacterium]